MPTLGESDLLTINNQNLSTSVTDLLNKSPFLAALQADRSSLGAQDQYLKETGAPVVGYRAANAGRALSKTTRETVTVDLKILDGSFHIDQAVADAYSAGAAALMGIEGESHLRESLYKTEQQILNGSDTDGFQGFADVLNALAHEQVIDAGGTADRTSVYMVRSTPSLRDVVFVVGMDGNISMPPFNLQEVPDPTDVSKSFPAYYQPLTGYTGVRVGSKWTIGRLANCGSNAGGEVTDDKLSELYETFPEPPTHVVMNRRSRGQLQRSRQAYHPLALYQPLPQEWEGVPIITVESLFNTEQAVI